MKLVAVVCALLFAVVSILPVTAQAGPGTLQEALEAGVIVPIWYNNHCDGLSLVLDTSTGVIQGHQTGCAAGRVMGTLGGAPWSPQWLGVTITYDYVADYAGVMTVLRADRTWSHYGYTPEGLLEEFNSGTWAFKGSWSLGDHASGEAPPWKSSAP